LISIQSINVNKKVPAPSLDIKVKIRELETSCAALGHMEGK